MTCYHIPYASIVHEIRVAKYSSIQTLNLTKFEDPLMRGLPQFKTIRFLLDCRGTTTRLLLQQVNTSTGESQPWSIFEFQLTSSQGMPTILLYVFRCVHVEQPLCGCAQSEYDVVSFCMRHISPPLPYKIEPRQYTIIRGLTIAIARQIFQQTCKIISNYVVEA